MDLANLSKSYSAAVDSFIDKLRDDPNVIATILCGSLSYDQVWEKSDIDMTLIVRDQKLTNRSYGIVEDGIAINVDLIERSEFRKMLEGGLGGMFNHSLFAKGKIIYSTEDSLYEYFEDFKKLGQDDIVKSLFFMSTELIGYLEKSEKWIRVKRDKSYSKYYILKAAGVAAAMEVVANKEIPTREAILRARVINPELMKLLYDVPLSTELTEEQILETISKVYQYLDDRIDIISKPITEYMPEGETKTLSVIAQHFNMEPHFIVHFLDFLCERGILERLSETIRITPKSKFAVEELAYVNIGNILNM